MAKKQRASEEESVPLAPEVSPPPVAFESYEIGRTLAEPIHLPPPLPPVAGHGISQKLSPKGWVAYRVNSAGVVDILTPKRADGRLEGESKVSASARMMRAIQDEYA